MTPTPEPLTVRVRIAVAVSDSGSWCAGGDDMSPNNVAQSLDHVGYVVDPGDALYWITADVPLPVAATIEGTVTDG